MLLLQHRSCSDTRQRPGGLFHLTVHLQQWNSHWEISRSCCERNLITCPPHLNGNEFWFQINPLWNFNYTIKAVICPRTDRVVTAELDERSAQQFPPRVQQHRTRHCDSFHITGSEWRKCHKTATNVFVIPPSTTGGGNVLKFIAVKSSLGGFYSHF